MGVTDLWKIFDRSNIGFECESLSLLREKKVAVDLSGWILQSSQVQCGQFTISNLPLRNLFWRVFHLVKHQVTPVFVIEGKSPDLKRVELDKRQECRKKLSERKNKTAPNDLSQREINDPAKKSGNGMSNRFRKLTEQCCELLDLLGVAWLQANGEAEATCAWLNQQGVVDGVITNDSDAFLFGAEYVYRNFTCMDTKTSYTAYKSEDVKAAFGAERSDLVAFALLLGSDYCTGVRSIGMEKVLKLLAEINGKDEPLNLLQRFRKWRVNSSHYELLESYSKRKKPVHCTICKHYGSKSAHRQNGCERCRTQVGCEATDSPTNSSNIGCSCDYHINLMKYSVTEHELKFRSEVLKDDTFPDSSVIDAYLLADSAVDKPEMIWRKPDFKGLQKWLKESLHWKEDTIETHVSQLMSAYAMYDKLLSPPRPGTSPVPYRILKETKRKGVATYHVEWQNGVSSPKNTVEIADNFRTSFPDVVKKYEEQEKKHVFDKLEKQKRTRRGRNSLLLTKEPNQPEISAFFKSKKCPGRLRPAETVSKPECDNSEVGQTQFSMSGTSTGKETPSHSKNQNRGCISSRSRQHVEGTLNKNIDIKVNLSTSSSSADNSQDLRENANSEIFSSIKCENDKKLILPEIIEIVDFDSEPKIENDTDIKPKSEIKTEVKTEESYRMGLNSETIEIVDFDIKSDIKNETDVSEAKPDVLDEKGSHLVNDAEVRSNSETGSELKGSASSSTVQSIEKQSSVEYGTPERDTFCTQARKRLDFSDQALTESINLPEMSSFTGSNSSDTMQSSVTDSRNMAVKTGSSIMAGMHLGATSMVDIGSSPESCQDVFESSCETNENSSPSSSQLIQQECFMDSKQQHRSPLQRKSLRTIDNHETCAELQNNFLTPSKDSQTARSGRCSSRKREWSKNISSPKIMLNSIGKVKERSAKKSKFSQDLSYSSDSSCDELPDLP